MIVVLLPGMDGTGLLFKDFVRLLPEGSDVKIVSYPPDTHLSYEILAERAMADVPPSEPYVIISESFSGPVAAILAARTAGSLQAVVFAASFVTLPGGRIGSWIADLLPSALFRLPIPAGILRWLLMDSDTPPELVSAVREAMGLVRPDVLTRRLRAALKADYAGALRHCPVRTVCLFARADRFLGTRGRRGFLAAKPDIDVIEVDGPHMLLQCAPERSFAALRNAGLFR